jgi:hypothetical protein
MYTLSFKKLPRKNCPRSLPSHCVAAAVDRVRSTVLAAAVSSSLHASRRSSRHDSSPAIQSAVQSSESTGCVNTSDSLRLLAPWNLSSQSEQGMGVAQAAVQEALSGALGRMMAFQ